MASKILLAISVTITSNSISVNGFQEFIEAPTYREVNPGGEVVLPCVVKNKAGECRWEKDGTPVGMYENKYEWHGQVQEGDCSLKVKEANIDYDNGVWQCQVTASDFTQRDTLISEGAELVVRVPPQDVVVRKMGDSSSGSDVISGSAGDELSLECVSNGGNPAPTLKWMLRGQELRTQEVQEDLRQTSGRWTSISRLRLPVNRDDNLATVYCQVFHDALEDGLASDISLNIFYPPKVTATASKNTILAEGDSVTLFCEADSNPPATVSWRKLEKTTKFIGNQPTITISSVTKDSAGSYQCVAENELGRSQPETINVDVQYAPVISKVGPSVQIDAEAGEKLLLTCSAAGSPKPNYQWLQQLPTGEVLVRGYEPNLVIESVNYEHQGEFVCKANNIVGGEKREVQSEPIDVTVKGKPKISGYSVKSELVVKTGEDATIEVEFCANPKPKQTWDIGPVGSEGNRVELNSRTRHGRFVVDQLLNTEIRDCYVASLRILGVHPSDSRSYPLQLVNEHGADEYSVKLVVINTAVSQEIFIAIVVGGILTILLFSLIIIYLVKADKCCNVQEKKMTESDKTDVESCHSSTVSGHTDKTVIPPDALYGTAEKKKMPFSDHLFNDSHERLRPDLLSATNSRSGSPNQGFDSKATYNELCFPKASNCGSMKRKKQRNQGVECQLSINTYGYINYLNNENDLVNARNKLNSVDNRLYE